MVEDLDAWHADLPRLGAQILDPPKTVPSGRNMRVKHPDGMVAYYVECFLISDRYGVSAQVKRQVWRRIAAGRSGPTAGFDTENPAFTRMR